MVRLLARLLAAGLLVVGNLYVLWGPSTTTPPRDTPLIHWEVTRYGVLGYRLVETGTVGGGSWCVPPGRRLTVENPPPVERRSTLALVLTAIATAPVLYLGGLLVRRVVSS